MHLITLTGRKSLSDKVASVRCSIDNKIIGCGRNTSLKDSLKCGKIIIIFGKGKVINENDEFKGVFAYRFCYIRQLVKLLFLKLDKP